MNSTLSMWNTVQEILLKLITFPVYTLYTFHDVNRDFDTKKDCQYSFSISKYWSVVYLVKITVRTSISKSLSRKGKKKKKKGQFIVLQSYPIKTLRIILQHHSPYIADFPCNISLGQENIFWCWLLYTVIIRLIWNVYTASCWPQWRIRTTLRAQS